MTIKEKVYESIYKDICDGVYEPNQIITENSLSAKYQVSKTPIREALIDLCKDRILQNMPRLGYLVRAVSLREVFEVIDFRMDVEISGLKRGFEKISDQDVKELWAIVNKKPEEIDNPDWDRNVQFHLRLYQITRSEFGFEMLQNIISRNTRYITQYFQSEWKFANQNKENCHAEIVRALEERNLEHAIKALEKDIKSVRDQIMELHQ